MHLARPLILIVPTVLIACAQAVSQDFVDDEGEGASGPNTGGTIASDGGKSNSTGGKTGSVPTAGKGGTSTQAFGGTSTTGGTDTGEGGEGTGGSGGGSTGGSGGQASAGGSGGSGGKSSGGSAGTGGTAGSSGSGGSGGTGQVGTGDCAGTPVFEAGAATKYAKDALVVAVCMGGTTCTQEVPPLTQGKQYEFKCVDEYNCGRTETNPATTNWSTPPWKVTRACE
jgi:hypothetical protein